jgi:hypothetical protein
MWESLPVEENSSATCENGMWERTSVSMSLLSTEIKTEMQLEAAYSS